MATVVYPTRLRKPQSPNLPLGDETYSRYYQDQLNSVLRLYFNQLGNTFDALLSDRGGKYLAFPQGSFQTNTNVTIAAINTPTLATLSTTDTANGMYLVPGDGIHVEQGGYYNYQFSIQFTNTDTQIHDAFVWLRLNGTDLAWTGSEVSVPNSHGGNPGRTILAANFFLEMQEGDYVEMWWAANSTQVYMSSIPAQTSPYVRPGSPALVVTVSFVSALPT